MKEKKLRIGVCGIGSIGFRHARLLSNRNDVELFLCDTTQAFLESAKDLPNLKNQRNLLRNYLTQIWTD